jgi:hypothetical protein
MELPASAPSRRAQGRRGRGMGWGAAVHRLIRAGNAAYSMGQCLALVLLPVALLAAGFPLDPRSGKEFANVSSCP